MFTIPVYIAILTGRRITDVLRVFETPEEAILQCRTWMGKVPNFQENRVYPGYLSYAQYGTTEDTVRGEKQQLELQDTPDTDRDDDASYIPGPAPVTWLRPAVDGKEAPDAP